MTEHTIGNISSMKLDIFVIMPTTLHLWQGCRKRSTSMGLQEARPSTTFALMMSPRTCKTKMQTKRVEGNCKRKYIPQHVTSSAYLTFIAANKQKTNKQAKAMGLFQNMATAMSYLKKNQWTYNNCLSVGQLGQNWFY